MDINTTKLYEKFIDIKNILNLKLMICYDVLFIKDGLLHNIAFYAIIIIIIFHFVTIIIFYNNKIYIIKDKIKEISFGINNLDLIKRKKEKEKLKQKKINITKNKNKKIKTEKKIKLPSPVEHYFLNKMKFTKNKKNKEIKLNITINNNQKERKRQNISNTNESINKKELIKKAKEIMNYNDEEMNSLSYELALKYDKKTYCEYYLSLIKTKNILIFSFYNNRNDYNSQIIKINLFFIGFIINFFVNALFFNEEAMHQILEKKGKFDFIYQLPQIIYSTIIFTFLNTLLKILALSQGNIINFKRNKNAKDLNKRKEDLNFLLKVKFILYFIISIIFLIFFWYYLSMFCAIYKNTQIYLIKDTLISFVLSLLYPFGIYLIPGIFRIPALSDRNNKRICLYNFSILMQMI